MPVYDLYSKRLKAQQQADQPDVYQYETLPLNFRWQVIHIWKSTIGERPPSARDDPYWQMVCEILTRELGSPSLGHPRSSAFEQCQQYLLTAPTLGALDIIELTFRMLDDMSPDSISDRNRGVLRGWMHQTREEAIEELNIRFQEHGIGYQFTSGRLIRIDSQYIHIEATKPALALLQDARFQTAETEFLQAYTYYRDQKNQDVIVWALKALESTLKIICAARNWAVPPNAMASQLINVVVNNGLIPTYLLSHFNALQSVLDSGLPTLRNKTSGHGQGTTPIIIPTYYAGYALHLAASNIVFLVEADKALP